MPFSAFWIVQSPAISLDVVLGRDWFAFVSHAFPNATITLSETKCLDFSIFPRVGVRLIEEGALFPVLIFDERKLNLQSVVAEDDSMDCDANPYLIDSGVIGPGATFFDHSDIGPDATLLSCSSSLMSSKNPSFNGISHDKTCYTASIPSSFPTNVTDFLTFIESKASSCSVLLSIAQSHNITVPSKSVLEVIRNLISEHISSGSSCGEATLCSLQHEMLATEFDLDVLKVPSSLTASTLTSVFPYNDGPLQNVLLNLTGVTTTEAGEILLLLCKTCYSSLRRNKLPSLSIANQNFLGPIPAVLRDLTVVEEAMIARCRAKCWIVQLKEENQSIVMPDVQRGMKGHIIIYPQRPSEIARLLPPNMSDILSPICVLFVGSSPPSQDWLRDRAKPLIVR